MQIQNHVHTHSVRHLYFHDEVKILLALFGALVVAQLCLPDVWCRPVALFFFTMTRNIETP
jgi:hypothetical protein